MSLVEKALSLAPSLRSFDGPLTEDLVREPGKFGLGAVPRQLSPDATTTAVCGYCSTGCGLNLHLRDGEAINLTADTDYPVNLGMACPKGWEALAPLDADDRALTPLLRRRGHPEDDRPIDWQSAAETFAKRMHAVADEHGPESIAFLSTGQICTEEMALLGAFAKFGMGMVHGDGNTRQCMATAVAAYKESFGFDAPPYTYADFEKSDVIVLVGSNLCIAHPIMWQRILHNPHSPEIIVIDPRKTETAMQATRHVALAPKSDLMLLYGLARRLIEIGAVDANFVYCHTRRYDQFADHVAQFSPADVTAATGLSETDLNELADTIASGKRVSFWWTMGVNQSHEATRTAQAIINLALMTGNIGRPGTGANSITGQCNAMGSRLFSNTTNLLGGHDFTNAEHREKIAAKLNIDAGRIPDRNSLAYDQIIDAIDAGKIKALWVIATNGAHSWIDSKRFNKILDKLDFLVVQDLYTTTETAEHADLILPAAGWGEKDGTLINSERRIGLVKKVRRAPGQALADFSIFRLLANAYGRGCPEMFADWETPETVFQILKKLSHGQPCDFSGIADYQMIDNCGGIQWPLAEGSFPVSPQRRLFENRQFYTDDGRARFCFDQPQPNPEPVDRDYPLCLITGRGSSAQWHTETRTGKSGVLRKLAPGRTFLDIHPDDAAALNLVVGDRVEIRSRRGRIEVHARLTPTVAPGQVYLPMHDRATNQLTRATFDPQSRQPSYKNCAVSVRRIS